MFELLGGLASGLLNFFGGKDSEDKQRDAAQQAQAAALKSATPYNISTALGRTNIKGKSASATLSPKSNALFNKAYSRASTFNPTGFSNSLFQQWNQMMAPEFQKMLEDAQSSLWGTGKLGTTSGDYLYSTVFDKIGQAKSAYALDSITKAQDYYDQLLADYYKTGGAIDNYFTLGSQLAGNTANAGIAGANWVNQAGMNAADASAAFWSTLGNQVGTGIAGIGNRGGSNLFGFSPFTSSAQGQAPGLWNDFTNYSSMYG